MNRRIYRYAIPLDAGPKVIRGPFVGDKVTALPSRTAPDQVDIWLETDSDRQPRERAFLIVGTGHPLPPGFWWVATVPGVMGLIWHVLEGPADPKDIPDVVRQQIAGLQ